ncbi:hypothetical protein pipiens_007659 [Culex pipiens pipiens]|uniref:Uncharacterized protein n=1 Tax=Culex pipiens pipiens TaxID=38569 RepID=A0ABD1DKV3_CULPP
MMKLTILEVGSGGKAKEELELGVGTGESSLEHISAAKRFVCPKLIATPFTRKEFYAPKHSELEQIPNRHAIETIQSLNSLNFVKEQLPGVSTSGICRSYLPLLPEIDPSMLTGTERAGAASRPVCRWSRRTPRQSR